jgi:hypothetical protein
MLLSEVHHHLFSLLSSEHALQFIIHEFEFVMIPTNGCDNPISKQFHHANSAILTDTAHHLY